MEAILAFLFDNPYLAFILLVFLFSLLGRSGRRSGGGSRMPDFGGGTGGGRRPGQPRPPGGPNRPGEMRGRPEAPRRPEIAQHPDVSRYPDGSPQTKTVRTGDGNGRTAFPREVRPDAHHREVRVDLRPARMSGTLPGDAPEQSRTAAPAASSAPDLPAARSAGASGIAPALQVERRAGRSSAGLDELRKAVIWAEILGPPRALRPPGRRRFGR